MRLSRFFKNWTIILPLFTLLTISVVEIASASQVTISIPNAGFEDNSFSGWNKGSQTSSLGPSITQSGTGVSIFSGSRKFTYGAHGSVGSPTLPNGSPNPYYAPAVSAGSWQFSPNNNSYAALLQPKNEQNFSQAMTALGLSGSPQSAIQSLLVADAQASANGGSPNPTDAAWITRDVQLTAGVIYTMSWNYVGTDYVPFNDGSLTSLVAVSTPSAPVIKVNNFERSYALLGFTNPGTGDYSVNSFGSTGWQVSTYEVSVTGTYKLGFAVFNLGDTGLSPVLMIDNAIGTTNDCDQSGNNCIVFGGVEPNNDTAPTVAPTSTSTTSTSTTSTTEPPSETTIASQTTVAPETTIASETTVENTTTTTEQTVETTTTTTTSTIPPYTAPPSETTQPAIIPLEPLPSVPDEEEIPVDAPEATNEEVVPEETLPEMDQAPDQEEPLIEDTVEDIENTITETTVIEESQEESSGEITDLIIEDEITEEAAVEIATTAAVLMTLSGDDASKVFSSIDTSSLDESEKIAIIAAVQNAPDEVREAFEEEINIYIDGFDQYIPLGSSIDVGTRRSLIAVTTATATLAVGAAVAGSSSSSRSGSSNSQAQTSGSNSAYRKEEEADEAAGELAELDHEDDERFTRNSIFNYYTIGGVEMKKFDIWGFLKKLWDITGALAFTLAGSVIVFITLSGETRKMAMIATAAALIVHYIYTILKNDE